MLLPLNREVDRWSSFLKRCAPCVPLRHSALARQIFHLKRSECRPACVGVHDASWWKHVAVRRAGSSAHTVVVAIKEHGMGSNGCKWACDRNRTTCDSHTFYGWLKFRWRKLSRGRYKNVLLGTQDTQMHIHKHTPLLSGVSVSSCGMLCRHKGIGRGESFRGSGVGKRREWYTHAEITLFCPPSFSTVFHTIDITTSSNTSHSRAQVPVNPHLIPCCVGVNLPLHLHSSGDNDIISTH